VKSIANLSVRDLAEVLRRLLSVAGLDYVELFQLALNKCSSRACLYGGLSEDLSKLHSVEESDNIGGLGGSGARIPPIAITTFVLRITDGDQHEDNGYCQQRSDAVLCLRHREFTTFARFRRFALGPEPVDGLTPAAHL